MSKISNSTTVAIIHGFGEGWLSSGLLRAELETKGYRIIKDAKTADVIIAHSGGCFMVPPDARAKLVLLIGISYWPKKPWFVCMAKKIWYDARHFRQERTLSEWFRKTAANTLYIGNLPRNMRMWHAWKIKGTIWKLPSATTVAIRNQYDVFCTPELSELPFEEKIHFIELPGQHDDLWINPKPYVDVVKSYV